MLYSILQPTNQPHSFTFGESQSRKPLHTDTNVAFSQNESRSYHLIRTFQSAISQLPNPSTTTNTMYNAHSTAFKLLCNKRATCTFPTLDKQWRVHGRSITRINLRLCFYAWLARNVQRCNCRQFFIFYVKAIF